MRPLPILLACLPFLAAPALAGDDGLTQEQLEELTAEIKGDIEEMRGQAFLRPVSVAVTDGEGFLTYIKARLDQMTTPEELAAEELTAKLCGLIPPDMDFLAELLALIESQVGGFYDPETESFYLMASFTGPLAGTILAHELTHALDDQLYDLDAGFEARKHNADALWAYQAVVEGSGTALMNEWTLRNAASFDMKEMMEMMEQGLDGLRDAQPYLYKPLLGSYVRGEKFLASGSVEEAFAAPPRSSEQVLHPKKYWDPQKRDEPVPVEIVAARLPAGWDVLAENTMGELGLALLTEPVKKRKGIKSPLAMMAVRYTNKAAKGWGGDRYVLLGKGDAALLHLATTWDSEQDAVQFHEALEELLPHLAQSVAGYAAFRAADHEGFNATGVGVRFERDGSRVFLTVGYGAGDALLGRANPGWADFPEPESD